jgi:chromatin structure-remodeling complex protein RSC7
MRSNPHKVYLLSVDAARTVGFRDSLSLFRSHLRLVKLALLPQEKDDLIAAGRLNAQLRGRNVTIVTAKSIFKQFGAKAIKGGRAVIDDYYEADAKAALEKSGRHEDQGQVVEAEDYRSHAERRRDADRERDRTRRPPDAHTTALYDFHGNLVTTTFGDNGAPPFVRSSGWPSRRAAQIRADLSEENWMLEMARNVQGMNAELAENRKERLMKFTDPVEGVNAAYAEEQQRLQEKRKTKLQQQYSQSQQLAPLRLQLLPGEVMDVDGVGSSASGEESSATIAPVHPVQVSGQASPAVGDAESAVTPLAPATSETDGDDMDDHQADRYKDLTNVLVPPVGLYDPTTNLPHFSSSTQPRAARVEKIGKRPLFQSLPGQREAEAEEEEVAMKKRQRERAVLLGTRIGSGAMGVASWSTAVDVGVLNGAGKANLIPAGGAGGES